MKKVFPVILSLMFLTACGISTPDGTPAPGVTPEPTPGPEIQLAALPSPGPQPDYIPPMDFTPVSVWEAEPFGDCGQALLYMGEEVDGAAPFKVFSSYRYNWTGTDQIRTTDCRSFSGTLCAVDGRNNFYAEFGSNSSERYELYLGLEACLSDVSGTADLDGTTLTLQYTDATPYADYVSVEKSFDGDPYVTCTFRSADYSLVEYLPSRFTQLPQEQLAHVMYRMPAFVEETDTGESFRRLKVGNNISDILSRIPLEYPQDAAIVDASDISLYGKGESNMFGALLKQESDGSLRVLVCAFDIITYSLDENWEISDIETFLQTYYLN